MKIRTNITKYEAVEKLRKLADYLENSEYDPECNQFIIESYYLTKFVNEFTYLTYLSTSLLIRTDKIDNDAPVLCKGIQNIMSDIGVKLTSEG